MNLDLLRSFFVIAEQGSLSRAAERLRVAQSTLTRQMHALEAEVGGRLLERGSGGVALTGAGHVLLAGMKPLVERFEAVLGEARSSARGQSDTLRVGYLGSAAADYLNPALAQLRRRHPEIRVRLSDLSPGEQIRALRSGGLDLALLGNARAVAAREFFVKAVASVAVLAVLPEGHALAGKPSVRLADLKGELFVGAKDDDLPGYNQWVVQLCRRAGFRPRFVLDADSLAHALSTVVAEGAVGLLPDYSARARVPGVIYLPVADPGARWELQAAWQRGKSSAAMKAMLEALPSDKRG